MEREVLAAERVLAEEHEQYGAISHSERASSANFGCMFAANIISEHYGDMRARPHQEPVQEMPGVERLHPRAPQETVQGMRAIIMPSHLPTPLPLLSHHIHPTPVGA